VMIFPFRTLCPPERAVLIVKCKNRDMAECPGEYSPRERTPCYPPPERMRRIPNAESLS